jgi:hypothetical protein
MSLEEFKNWQERKVHIRELIVVDILFQRVKFIGHYNGKVLILYNPNPFLKLAISEINFELLEEKKQVKIKTDFPFGWIVLVLGFFMSLVMLFEMIIPNDNYLFFSDLSFVDFATIVLVPVLILLVSFVLLVFCLSYCVSKVHRLVKESLLIK